MTKLLELLELPDLVLHNIVDYLDHREDMSGILLLHTSRAFLPNEKILSLKLTDTENFFDKLYENGHEKYKYLRELDISSITFKIENKIIPKLSNLCILQFDCASIQLTNYKDNIVVCLKCCKLKEVPNLPRLLPFSNDMSLWEAT